MVLDLQNPLKKMTRAHNNSTSMQWNPYFFKAAKAFDDFYKDFLKAKARDFLFIIGRGIDPRMCAGFQKILEFGGTGKRDVFLINFDEGDDSQTNQHSNLAKQNVETLKELLGNGRKFSEATVPIWTESGPSRRRIAAPKTIHLFNDVSKFVGYTDVVIDISAMRRGVYLSFIAHVMQLIETQKQNGLSSPNLHVICANSPGLDKRIAGMGLDETADYVTGFVGDLDMHSNIEVPTVWIPILGGGQEGKLERIYTLVKPAEICPVLPSPSLSGKRADDLIKEYWRLLLDTWGVESGNVLFASEGNPFDIYRQIHRVVNDYNRALKPIGGCKIAVSVLGNKVLSIGALLACYELRKSDVSIGIAHVESQGYEITSGKTSQEPDEIEFTTTWILGECYD